MATKYGYVSRDTANRQIDWNAIGTQVSDGITKITEDRKERREDILTKSTDYAKMLIDMPMGSNTAFNEYLAQFTTQASKAALSDLNLLKSGEISEQEYYNRRANLLSGTELMISGANNFNKNYDVIQERIDNGTASVVEIKYREKMAQLLEFGNRTPFINPDTREVNTARLAPSGIMETTVEDIASASDMFRISNFQLNKFDMNSAIESMKTSLGVQQYTEDGTGNSIKYAFNEQLMSTNEINEAKKELVSSYLKDDKAVISILGDYVPDYDVTLDPFAVNDKTVLIGRNGAYEISDAQRKAAEEYMIKQLDRALPKTEKPGISKFQKETLKNERERIQIAKDNLALATQKANVDSDALSYEAADNFMVDPDAAPGVTNKFIKPKDYIKKLNSNSFKSNTIEKTVDGLQSVLKHQGMKDAVVNTIVIEPPKKGGSKAGNLIRLQALQNYGAIPKTKFTDATFGVEINIPGVLTEPVVLPIKYRPEQELNSLLETIDYAKENNLQVTPDNIAEILNAPNRKIFNNYRNAPVNEEEEIVVENVIGGVDKIKNVINQTQNNNID